MQEMNLREMATALRILSVDMIERAKSGHPGAPLGLADVVTVLWSKFLRFDAAVPDWFDRDRFVLSGGHASALLYSLLHLTGNPDITMDEIKQFRQLGSKTAGHPEKTLVDGIDFSTGPLGQGLAGAVGMALAERMMNARFGDNLVNHKTYVTCGDGDLMEGISEEAISLAGHWRLNRLIVLWDDNHITIDGRTDIATSTDMKQRFEANHWLVLSCDGHDYESIEKVLDRAQLSDRPVFIDCRTIIGFGAPTKCNSPKVHGSPLGEEEVRQLRLALNWPYPPFDIPVSVREAWQAVGARGEGDRLQWEQRVTHDGNKELFFDYLSGLIPADLTERLRDYKQKLITEKEAVATRKASQNVLAVLTEQIPYLIGGSADLAGACYVKTPSSDDISRQNYSGNYINYGIRELAMAAIMNGLAAHGGFIPYGSTFLSFADYIKPTLRLGALMELQEFFVLTHDSLGVGEDGPTHQPIEQLAMLRATPNVFVFRPADSVETVECYETALILKNNVSVMALSRQALPVVRTDARDNLSARGGYVLADTLADRQVTLIATGSEVSLALAAKEALEKEGIDAAVVSMPCVELFEQQPVSYRDNVLGTAPRVIIEAASTWGWDRFLSGVSGAVIGIDTFGASGKGSDVLAHFGFTVEHIVETVKKIRQGS
ncbi:MAG: transketolase [Alphaproteobacteria bacterium]|nr:transketolase [Alphaproteobacteria bacterium]